MKRIILMLTICFMCSSVFAKNYDICYKVFTGVNGKKYCNVHSVMNWFSAVAFCKANGFEIASINDLCDINSEPANRFKGGWKFAQYDACPNTIGAEVGSLSNYKWSSSPSDTLGHMFARAGDGRVCDYQLSTRDHTGPYGVICDTGECGDGFSWSASENRCMSAEEICGATPPEDLATITSQMCCEHWNLTWNETTNTCGCPTGTSYLEPQVCVPDNMCVYYFERPADSSTIQHSYQDCSSGDCVNSRWSEVPPLTYRVIKDECEWPRFCVLNAVDVDGTRDDYTITGYMYGRCEIGN